MKGNCGKIRFAQLLLLVAGLCIWGGCRPVNIGQELRHAHDAARKGDWQTALALSEKCLSVVPGEVNAMALKGLAMYKLSPSDAEAQETARDLLQQAVTRAPDRYDVQLLYGWLILKTGKPKDAIGPLLKAYTLHNSLKTEHLVGQASQATVKYTLGECYFQNSNFAEAEKYYRQAVKSAPFPQWGSWSVLQNNIARLTLQNGSGAERFQQAYQLCKQAYLSDKENLEILVNLCALMDYLSSEPIADQRYLKPCVDTYRFALYKLMERAEKSKDPKEQQHCRQTAEKIAARLAALKRA